MARPAAASHEPARHYDTVTEAWRLLMGDELHYGVFTHGDEALGVATAELTSRMVAAAGLTPGLRVLDVGCGTGAPACELASEHGVEVLGITTSEVGVAVARERARQAGLGDRVQFDQRDGTATGFSDASFDRIWVLESSHLMRAKSRLVAEAARMLRPGGRLVLCDVMLRRPMPFEEVRRLRTPLSVLRDAFGDAHMAQLSDYEAWSRQAGLTVTEAVDLTEATRPTFARWRANADQHRARVIELIGVDGWDSFVSATTILEGFWDDGTLGYGLVAGS